MCKQLQDYANEIGVSSFTIQEIIDSHRRLREANKIRHQQWLDELTKAREIGIQQAEALVKEQGWFSAERLRAMTLSELVELLRTD